MKKTTCQEQNGKKTTPENKKLIALLAVFCWSILGSYVNWVLSWAKNSKAWDTETNGWNVVNIIILSKILHRCFFPPVRTTRCPTSPLFLKQQEKRATSIFRFTREFSSKFHQNVYLFFKNESPFQIWEDFFFCNKLCWNFEHTKRPFLRMSHLEDTTNKKTETKNKRRAFRLKKKKLLVLKMGSIFYQGTNFVMNKRAILKWQLL